MNPICYKRHNGRLPAEKGSKGMHGKCRKIPFLTELGSSGILPDDPLCRAALVPLKHQLEGGLYVAICIAGYLKGFPELL